jgi:hypothetical protein
MAEEKWAFQADYVETCNCDYGCPCNFSGFPTDNKCEALVAALAKITFTPVRT